MQLTTPPFSFVLGIGKLNSQEFSITCGTRIRKILWRGEVTKVMQWSLARQCVASKKKNTSNAGTIFTNLVVGQVQGYKNWAASPVSH